MAISLINSTSNSGSTTSLSINRPADATDNDVMYAFVCNGDNTTITGPTEETWTQDTQEGTGAGDDRQISVWYRVITDIGSESSSYSWTTAATEDLAGCILLFRGVDTSTPIDCTSSTSTSSNSTTIQLGQITTVTASAMCIGAAMVTQTRTSFSWDDYAEEVEVLKAPSSGFGASHSVCYEIQVSAGGSAQPTCTVDSNDGDGYSIHTALRPAPSGGTPLTIDVADVVSSGDALC